jgi:hypothetical protein
MGRAVSAIPNAARDEIKAHGELVHNVAARAHRLRQARGLLLRGRP